MNTLLRWAITIGLFAVLFVPLIVSNELFFPFITGKAFVFRVLVEIVFGLYLILALYDPNVRPKKSSILFGFIALVGVMLLATFGAENVHKSFWSNFERMEGYLMLLHLFGYFVVLGSMFVRDIEWDRWLHTSLGVSTFLIFYSVLQIAGALIINQGGLRIDATFGNAAYFASYLLIHVFITFFLAVSPRIVDRVRSLLLTYSIGFFGALFWLFFFFPGRYMHEQRIVPGSGFSASEAFGAIPALGWITLLVIGLLWGFIMWKRRAMPEWGVRLLYGVPIVANSILIYYTGTRGAFIGLVGGLFVLLVLTALKHNDSLEWRKWARMGLVALVLLGIGFSLIGSTAFVQKNPILKRFATLVSVERLTNAAEPRLAIWGSGIKGFLERPLLGWGQEGFNFAFNKFYDPGMYGQEQWFDRTHNIFLDWLVAGGILGFIAYLSLYIGFLTSVWKQTGSRIINWLNNVLARFGVGESENGFSYAEKVTLTALIAGYFFQNFFVFDNIASYIFFVSLLAFVHSVVGRETKWTERQHIVPRYMRLSVACLLFIVMIGGAYWVNAPSVNANKMLIKAITPPQSSFTENTQAFRDASAYNAIGTAEVAEQGVILFVNVKDNPGIPREQLEDHVRTIDQLLKKEIARIPTDARLHYFRGILLSKNAEFITARESFESALALSPNKQQLLTEIAVTHINQDNGAVAIPLLKQSYELDMENQTARNWYGLGLLIEGDSRMADEILLSNLTTEPIYIPDDRVVRTYEQFGREDVAVQIREARTLKDPNRPELWAELAGGYLRLEQREKAIEAIQRAIEIDEVYRAEGEEIIRQIQAGQI